MDIRLLEVLGFKDAIKILTQEKAKLNLYEEKLNRKAKIEGGIIGSPRELGQDYSEDWNILGTGAGSISETKTKRNPKAEAIADQWQRSS